MPAATFSVVLDGVPHREGNIDDRVSLGTDLALTRRGNQIILQAFSSRDKFATWAQQQGWDAGLDNAIRKAQTAERRGRAMQEREPEPLRQEIEAVRQASERVDEALKSHGVRGNDVRAITRLAAQGALGTILCYDNRSHAAPKISFPPGVYRKLSSHGWNDRISSLINLNPYWITLYQHTYFRGERLWINPVGFPGCAPTDLGWFNNRASSIIC
jgi:hypothetical protein